MADLVIMRVREVRLLPIDHFRRPEATDFWTRYLVVEGEGNNGFVVKLFADSRAALILAGETVPEPEIVPQAKPQEPAITDESVNSGLLVDASGEPF